MAEGEPRSISIPEEVYASLQDSLIESGASSVDELAKRIIRDWLTAKEASARSRRTRLSKTDEDIVQERLKALGYV